MHSLNRSLFVAGACAMISACASATYQPVAVGSVSRGVVAPGSNDASRNPTPLVDILQYIDIKTPAGARSRETYVGGYTKLYVAHVDKDGGEAAGYKAREPMARFFAGKSASRALLFRVKVSDPGIAGTVTVASSTDESTRKTGESWKRDLDGDRFLTPYFRVEPTTTITLTTELATTFSQDASAIGDVLSTVKGALAIVAPSAALVTTLNSDRVSGGSQALESAVQQLFGESLRERSTEEFGPDQWSTTGIRTVTVKFPMDWKPSDEKAAEIGQWVLKTMPARVSIFAETPLCGAGATCDSTAQAKTAFARLSPATVSNFAIAEGVPLLRHLAGQDAIASAIGRLNDAASATPVVPAQQSASAALLCSLVAAEANNIGLNEYDGAAVVWALSQSGRLNTAASAELLKEATCRASRLWNTITPT